MKVEIYRLQDDGQQKVIVTCRLKDGAAICDGEKTLTDRLNKTGVRDYSSSEPKTAYPKDGLKFLQQLKYTFKSGYLNASDVMED